MVKTAGKRPLGRPRCRRADNIKMDLQEVGYGGMDWIELVQYTNMRRDLVNARGKCDFRIYSLLG